MNPSSITTTETSLSPRENDVILGRGGLSNNNPGNIHFRQVVAARRDEYAKLTKNKEKQSFAVKIYEEILGLDPPGRFLQKTKDGDWALASREKAVDKVQHCLREKKNSETSQSNVDTESRHSQSQAPSQPRSPPQSRPQAQSQVPVGQNDQAKHENDERLIQDCLCIEIKCGGVEVDKFNELGDSEKLDLLDPSEARDQLEGLDYSEHSDHYLECGIDAFDLGLTFEHEYEDDFLSASNRESTDPESESATASASKCEELSLVDWITQNYATNSWRQIGVSGSSKYIDSSLKIALELAICLTGTETVPLASIATTHVKLQTTCAGGAESIEWVEFTTHDDESPIEGDIMLRLYSFGVILYELFSGYQLPPISNNVQIGHEKPSQTFEGITLADDSDASTESLPRGTKFQRDSTLPNVFAEPLLGMGLQGIPHSIISLVQNLLDSGEEEFCPDGAYKSFSDVRSDLSLMINEPTRFLQDTVINPQHPLRFSGKLCGRETETDSLRVIYENFLQGRGSGVIIKGNGGVGKTKLAEVVEKLTTRAQGYFLCGKFEQNFGRTNLSTIAAIFDRYCEIFVRDMPPKEKENAALAIENSLGEHLALLVEMMPSLSTLTRRQVSTKLLHSCIDQDSSVPYLFGTCLNILASHSSKPITAFFDDIQWADRSSFRLLQRLLHMFQGNTKIFFLFTCRDEDAETSEALSNWIQTIPEGSLSHLLLSNMDPDEVNRLVSDTLHLFPRLTRPLSAVIFHKTRGNPFFIGQMLNVMKKNRILSFRLATHRWEWDMEKVVDVEVPNTVLELLSKEMNRLPRFLLQGLKVSSCIGSNIFHHLIDLVPVDFGIDRDILRELSERGFLFDLGSNNFRFIHDKVQEAAYDTMTVQEKRRIHSTLGLTFSQNVTKNTTVVSDRTLFSSAVQLQLAGADVFSIDQRLNLLPILLMAGRKSMERSEFSVSFTILDCATSSFFDRNFWAIDYDLSIDLFNTATEVACALNDTKSVLRLANQILQYATFADQFDCQYLILTSLKKANRIEEAMTFALNTLHELGEDHPRSLDSALLKEIQCMNSRIHSLTDDTLLVYNISHDAELIFKMKLYMELNHLFMLTRPSQTAAVGLRMVQLCFVNGMNIICPHAFGCFGMIALSIGDPKLSYRLGVLAIKMIGKFGTTKYKSFIIGAVHSLLLWINDPFQLVSEMLSGGIECGRKSGDEWGVISCRNFSLVISYLAGEKLVPLKEKLVEFINDVKRTQHRVLVLGSGLLHSHISSLVGDPAAENAMKDCKHFTDTVHVSKCYELARAVYFRKFYVVSHDECNILKQISEANAIVRPSFIDGIFFSGLISFCFQRETMDCHWMKLGEDSLASIKYWSTLNLWNFEGKAFMLEAEKQFALGNLNDARRLYDAAISSSRAHRFIHDEALANDLAGMHYHAMKEFEKSFHYLRRAVLLYHDWGASAVAYRVERFIQDNLGDAAHS